MTDVLSGISLDVINKIGVDKFVEALPEDEVERFLLTMRRIEDEEKYGRFNALFPDEGPLRRGLYTKHMEFFRAGAKYRERCIMAGNRVGKAQPVDELVATPAGWVPIGSLMVGDEVLGANGKPTKVVGVFPQGKRKTVRLTASDGSYARCDESHLWSVRRVKGGRTSPYEPITAAQIMTTSDRLMLPERHMLEFQGARELPIDPYLVGLLLGDGGLTTDRVLITTVDQEIVEFCRQQAEVWGCELRQLGQTWHFASTKKIGGRWHNSLRAALAGLGMAGKGCRDKRVPPEYMVAAAEDRMAVLRGLMDTDGSCSKSNGARCFYSVNRSLCEDVAALARSLGMNAKVGHKKGQYNGRQHDSWKVHIAASGHSVFNLPRKKANERYAAIKMRGLMVESVKPDGEEECICIEVEAADHLYVTRDCLITHNTVAGSYECSCHLTGNYPHWWEGRRFSGPVKAWVAGKTNETTRDIVQVELLGNITFSGQRKLVDGTGIIPKDLLGMEPGQMSWKAGVADLVDMIKVRHKSGGWSELGLKSYQQGRGSFEGTARHVIWFDEEPPMDVYGEALMRTATTKGLIMLTFTPLEGMSDVVQEFLPKEMRPGGGV